MLYLVDTKSFRRDSFLNNEIKPKSMIVIFGATGDLARRKLFPSIYRLYQGGKIGEDFAVVGVARRPWTNDILRENVKASIQSDISANDNTDAFLSHFYYQPFDVTDTSSYEKLGSVIDDLEGTYRTDGNRIFYLAMRSEERRRVGRECLCELAR